MGYPELVDYSAALTPTTTGWQTALNIAATAAQYVGYAVLKPIAVKRIIYYVATASTGGTLNVTSCPTYASSANAVTLGTMALGTAGVGTVFYKDIKDATNITNTAIAEELSLPPVKIHCSILAEEAIKAAVADYNKKQEKK